VCDTDGDGVPDNVEIADGTDLNDPCDYLATSVTLTQGGLWNLADCDGDGVTNGTEVTDGTNQTTHVIISLQALHFRKAAHGIRLIATATE
jgi:hypothetical protein